MESIKIIIYPVVSFILLTITANDGLLWDISYKQSSIIDLMPIKFLSLSVFGIDGLNGGSSVAMTFSIISGINTIHKINFHS